MDKNLVSILDRIVKNEFYEYADIYEFEKENLFKIIEKGDHNKGLKKLNEFGITPESIPGYIVAITSIINVVIRLKTKRKAKIIKAENEIINDLRMEMQRNSLKDEIISVLLEKYSQDLVNNVIENKGETKQLES